MKKLLFYLVIIGIAIFILCFFAVPSLGQTLGDFVLANVVGDRFCPKGDGKTFTDELIVQVNKDISLPAGFIPADLVNISKEVKTINIICLKKEALKNLKQMFADASAQNINLAVTSGFRSSETQSGLYKALILLKGEKAKDRIAEPLHSEHQLGTTIDLSGASIGYLSANDKFIGTPEDLWLRDNAYKYGFVLSYPKGKTLITGYDYEPWHYRFLGTEIAKKVYDQDISIEEYFDNLTKKD
jgi:D-alanyl-D-alanine carboxypeptidase